MEEVVMILLFWGIALPIIIICIRTWKRNNAQPIIAHEVIVAAKSRGRGRNGSNVSMTFVFVETGKQQTFQLPTFDRHLYDEVNGGDRCILKMQGTRWILCDKIKS